MMDRDWVNTRIHQPPEHRACRSNTNDETAACRLATRRRTPWPTATELYADTEQTEPEWAKIPGLCDRVCPVHNRRCAQQHLDDTDHACVWCTTETGGNQ